MSLMIDGSNVTHEVLDCGGDAVPGMESVGSLDEAKTSIVWTSSPGSGSAAEGGFSEQDDVTVTETSVLFTSRLRDLMYVKADSAEADRERSAYEEACTGSE